MARVYTLSADFAVECGPRPAFDPDITDAVDALWNRQCQCRPGLFNSAAYSLVECRPDGILLAPVEYKQVLAHQLDGSLREAMGLRPLGITGLTTCEDGLLVGRRGSDVSGDAERWELVPAGSLDRPSPRDVLRAELREEVGLGADSVASLSVLGIVEDSRSGVCDIVFDLRLRAGEPEIQRAFDSLPRTEHSVLRVVPVGDVATFLENQGDHVVAAMQGMLRLGGMIR